MTKKSLESFVTDFSNIVNETCKEEISSKSKRNTLFKPWITPGIITSSKKKHKLYQLWMKTVNKNGPTDKGDPVLRKNYKTYLKYFKYIIRHAKNDYHKNKCNDAKGDLKATWKILNNLRGKTKSKIMPSFIIDGKLVTEKRKIANAFNDYFVSIAKTLNDNDNPKIEPLPDFTEFISKNNPNSMLLHECTSEIEDIIKSFFHRKIE